MSYGYGGGSNPYDQRGGGGAGNPPYPISQPSYGRQQYNNGPAMGRDDYSGQNVEMAPLAQNGQQFGRRTNNSILDRVQQIIDGTNEMESKFKQLGSAQTYFLNAVSDSDRDAASAELTAKSADIQASFKILTGKMTAIKQDPDSQSEANARHVARARKRLEESRSTYLKLEAAYRQNSKQQDIRQLRIAFPNASEAEIREAAENSSGQPIFAQAFAQSNRRDQAKTTLQQVQSRHEEIQKINQQMVELAELFQEMDALVVQQEAAVANIEMRGEEVAVNMDKGTEEIGVAIKSARNARKWKWWCLGICVLIIIIIVVVILIYKFVISPGPTVVKNNTTAKRYVLPGTPWPGVNTVAQPVIPGQPWTPPVGRAVAFVG